MARSVRDVCHTTAGCLLVAFCAVVLLTGCGENPAASEESPYDTGSMYWDVQGVQQAPTTSAWTHVWDQSYRNQMIGSSAMVAGGRLYQGGQGLLELDLVTAAKLCQETLLTPDEWDSEEKRLCCIVLVDRGFVVVSANSFGLCPMIELRE